MKNQIIVMVRKKLATSFYSGRKTDTLKGLNYFFIVPFFLFVFIGSVFPQNSSYKKELYNFFEVNTSNSPLIYFEQSKKDDSDQAELKKNCIYGVGGYAIAWGSYSIYYERIIFYSQNSIFKYFNIRIGGGHVEAFEGSGPFFLGTINMLPGKKAIIWSSTLVLLHSKKKEHMWLQQLDTAIKNLMDIYF